MKNSSLFCIIFITLISGCSGVKSSPQKDETFYTPKNWQEPLESNPPKIVEQPPQQIVEKAPQQIVEQTEMEVVKPPVQQNELASWYGTESSKELTANGEICDQEKLTAAHDLLPMGTWVEVTNLKNGQTVVVRVNDRGLEKENHIIKLTRKAAQQLDFLKQGTTPVSLKVVEAPVTESPTATESPTIIEEPPATVEPFTAIEPLGLVELSTDQVGDQAEVDEQFVVQVIVLKSEQNARSFQQRITTKYSSLTFQVEEYKDNTYRVFAGP